MEHGTEHGFISYLTSKDLINVSNIRTLLGVESVQVEGSFKIIMSEWAIIFAILLGILTNILRISQDPFLSE